MKSLGVHRNHHPHLPLMSHWPPQPSWFSWLSAFGFPVGQVSPLWSTNAIYFESWILKKNTQQKLSLKKKLHGDSAKDSMKGGKTYVTSTLQVGNFIFCIKDILKHNIPPLILQRKYETCFFGDGIRHVEDVVTELSTKVGYICKVAQLPPVENHQLPTPNSE